MAIGKLKSASVAGANVLKLAWDDGHEALIDLGPVIAAHRGLKSVRPAKTFARAKLSKDKWSIEWPGGIDFGATQLRRWADEQGGETMPAADLRDWMESHELTLDSAAEALGLSRRMIAYYLSGEKSIPKTVMLATKGWSAASGKSNTVASRHHFAEKGREVFHAKVAVNKAGKRTFAGRDSSTGEFVPVRGAKGRLSATVVERVPKPNRSDRKTR